MLQTGTILNVIDNSGAKKIMCIKGVNPGYKQRYIYLGSMVLVSIKSIRYSKNIRVKKGEIHKALVVRTKNYKKSFYNYRKYFENSAVLLNKHNKFLGTRIFGVIPKEFKYSKYLKALTISAGYSL